MSRSSLLYHGPSAQSVAATEAASYGRIVGMFGDPRVGLDAEVIREAVTALNSVPVGDDRGSIVIGPIDVGTRTEGIDALLKVLEEPEERAPRAFLWAWDEGSVRATIRSRCLLRWCPGIRQIDGPVAKAAREMVKASLAGEVSSIIETFTEVAATDAEKWRNQGPQFLSAAAKELSTVTDGAPKFRLWGSLRKVAAVREPSRNEMLEAFLP